MGVYTSGWYSLGLWMSFCIYGLLDISGLALASPFGVSTFPLAVIQDLLGPYRPALLELAGQYMYTSNP